MPTPIHNAMMNKGGDKFSEVTGQEAINKLLFSLKKYRKFLEDEVLCGEEISDKERKEWFGAADKIEYAINSGDPALMWEAVSDHWLDTEWDEDDMPEPFAVLYDAIDAVRTEAGIDSSSQIGETNVKDS